MAYSTEASRNWITQKQLLNSAQLPQWELEALFGIPQNFCQIDKSVEAEPMSQVRRGLEQTDSSSKDAKTLKLLADSLELLADKLEQECSFKNKQKKKSKKRMKRSTLASNRRTSVSEMHMEYLNSQPENILGKATSELHMMRNLSTRNDVIFNMALGVYDCDLGPVVEKGRKLPPERTQYKSIGFFPGSDHTEICYSPDSWLYA